MSDQPPPIPSIGEEGRRIRKRFKKLKRATENIDARERLATRGGPLPASIRAIPSPEHYHIVYEYDGNIVPHFAVRYARQRDAYLEVKRMGDESEPNTTWGDDGRVQIETRLHDRTGLFRVTLRIAACVATRCGKAPSPILLPTQSKGIVIPFPSGGKP